MAKKLKETRAKVYCLNGKEVHLEGYDVPFKDGCLIVTNTDYIFDVKCIYKLQEGDYVEYEREYE